MAASDEDEANSGRASGGVAMLGLRRRVGGARALCLHAMLSALLALACVSGSADRATAQLPSTTAPDGAKSDAPRSTSVDAATGAAAPSSPAPAAVLGQVDRAFLSAYGLAMREALSTGPPTLLVLSDSMVLYRAGNRRDVPLLPPIFNQVKTVSHVALGLFAILTLSDGQPLGTAHIDELGRFRTQIAAARGAIAKVELSEEQRARQNQILDASVALADRALAERRISEQDLDAYCAKMEPLVLANVTDGVTAYLDEINRRVTELLPSIPTGERGQLIVMVTGVHQARIDNAAVQYFERLLGNPPVIDQRVIYAENVRDEAGALKLLGGHLMDRRVGKAFFDDPVYMNSDLFGRDAKKLVPAMKLPVLVPASPSGDSATDEET